MVCPFRSMLSTFLTGPFLSSVWASRCTAGGRSLNFITFANAASEPSVSRPIKMRRETREAFITMFLSSLKKARALLDHHQNRIGFSVQALALARHSRNLSSGLQLPFGICEKCDQIRQLLFA